MAVSQCGNCGLVFNSVYGFDMHRVGKHTQHGPDYGRRCLTVAEMQAKGMAEHNGRWYGPSKPGWFEKVYPKPTP